jgi:hypothetical protein
LFAGPYKSIQIEAGLQLLNLTRYLHYLGGNYSSYPQYLGQSQTSWLKPELVLAFFDNKEGNYKDFVEKYQDSDNLLLEKAILEDKDTHLAKSLPKNQPESNPTRSPLPDFLAISTAIFLLLLTMGMGNISLVKAHKSQPLPLPSVLGKFVIAAPEPTATPEQPTAIPEPISAPPTLLQPTIIPEPNITPG